MSQTVFSKSNEEEGGKGGPKLSSIYTQIFYPFSSPKFLQDSA